MNYSSLADKTCFKFIALGACALALALESQASTMFYYDFENQSNPPTVYDTSGAGNNGTFVGNGTVGGGTNPPVYATPGYNSTGSILFGPGDTFNSGIQLSQPVDMTGNYTLSVAINPTTFTTGAIMLFGIGGPANLANSGDMFFALLRDNATTAHLYYNHGGGGLNFQSSLTVSTNVWQTVGLTRTGNTLTFFTTDASGTTTLTQQTTDSVAMTYDPLLVASIGYQGYGGGNETGYQGSMDNFAFNYTPVPEPSTVAMLVLGSGGLALMLRRRRPQV